jgi:hypothetical protein
MFDLKPDAPAEIRGPFSPIGSRTPGLLICEHLPLLAERSNMYTVLRAVSHKNSNHTPMIYYTLTGYATAFPERDNDIRPPQRNDFPHWGSVLARFQPRPGALPGYIAVPELCIRSSTSGEFKRVRTTLRGGAAGFLGARYDPLSVDQEPGTAGAVPAFALPTDVTPERFEQRAALLSLLENGRPQARETRDLADVRSQAVMLTGFAGGGKLPAFSLDHEPDAVRDRYGRHRFGQTMLLARRLTEAGVPMVAIHFNEMTVCDGWDTHSNNFTACQQELLPMLDQSLSALLDDLTQRGLIDETLVVVMGEFGRTPKINAQAGRDHWGDCSSVLLAGAGVQPGLLHGESDAHGAYPRNDAVDPTDIQATAYHCLGLDPRTEIRDELDRPFPISTGRVLHEILG